MEIDSASAIASRVHNEPKKYSESSTLFEIREHIIPCAYIREYPRVTATKQNVSIQLPIKQYVPL